MDVFFLFLQYLKLFVEVLVLFDKYHDLLLLSFRSIAFDKLHLAIKFCYFFFKNIFTLLLDYL